MQLTATAALGASFTGWSGDLTGSTNPASITINGNKEVIATFTPIEYNLTVTNLRKRYGHQESQPDYVSLWRCCTTDRHSLRGFEIRWLERRPDGRNKPGFDHD